MRVCPGPSLPELYAGLQIYGMGVMEWQSPEGINNASVWIGGTNNGDVGILKRWLGSGDNGFEEYGR